MDKLKLLIIGTDEVWSIDKLYYQHLQKTVIDIQFFAAENLFDNFYHKSILNKIIFKLSLSDIYKTILKQAIKVIEAYRPDIIWIFKGMSISPELLYFIKKKGIMLVNYNPDNPFIFSGRGSGNANITNSIGLYDLHLTYNLEVKERLEKEYQIKTGYLPFGYEIPLNILNGPISPEINKLCFIGNPDKYRAELILKLVQHGVEIDVYGHNWQKYISHSNLHIHGAVYSDELWRTMRKYRLQLNIMRVHNLNSHNMRSFEVPGSGSIMIAPDTKEHRMFFENEKEVFLYSDLENCTEVINKVLNMNEEQALNVRLSARKRSSESNYTYEDRAKEALELIKTAYES